MTARTGGSSGPKAVAFTSVTVTGSYGEAPGGTITFTLCQPMTNQNVIAPAEPIVVTLTGGTFSQELLANNDPGTVPQGVWYGVTEQIAGCQPRDYFISVPAAAATVDISTLMPATPAWQ
jgi:hypothetical protein